MYLTMDAGLTLLGFYITHCTYSIICLSKTQTCPASRVRERDCGPVLYSLSSSWPVRPFSLSWVIQEIAAVGIFDRLGIPGSLGIQI